MKSFRFGIPFLAIMVFGLKTSAFAQTTQPICIAADVVVDAGGSDANPGTRRLPVKTIGKAISLAGVNGVVLVNPGTFCESLKLLDGQESSTDTA